MGAVQEMTTISGMERRQGLRERKKYVKEKERRRNRAVQNAKVEQSKRNRESGETEIKVKRNKQCAQEINIAEESSIAKE